MPQRRYYVLVAFLAGCALYGLTTAPGVLWQDSATFQFRVWHGDLLGMHGLALSHPLYILLAGAFAKLPLTEDFACRVNLFGGLCAAGCAALLMDLLLTLTRCGPAALCGTLLLAVSHTFWTHAVIAEVYDLYALGLVAELWLLERFCRVRRPGWLMLAVLINGLNVSNHLLALLHAPAYGWLLWTALRRGWLRSTQLAVLPPLFLMGLGPYLWIIAGEINRPRPPLDVLLEACGASPDRAESVFGTTFPFITQTIKTAQAFALNFPTPLILLAPIGLWAACRRRSVPDCPHPEAQNDSRVQPSLVTASRPLPGLPSFVVFGVMVFTVNFVFAFRYQVPDQYAFFTGCYVLAALFTGLGANWALHATPGGQAAAESTRAGPRPPIIRRHPVFMTTLFIALALLPAAVYEVLPTAVRRWNWVPVKREIPFRDNSRYWIRPRKNGENSGERYARRALRIAGPDGLLAAGSDSTVKNTLVYVRDVLRVEPGVTLHFGPDTVPAPPVIPLTAETVRPFAEAGKAWVTTDVWGYMPIWMWEQYVREPDDILFRLQPRRLESQP